MKEVGAVAAAGIPDDHEALMQAVREKLREHAPLLRCARSDAAARRQVRDLVAHILARDGLGATRTEREQLADRLCDDLVGLGPVEPYLRDEEVTEVMINGPNTVYVERNGVIELTPAAFRGPEHLEDVIQRIVAPLGRRIDQSNPFVDARLPDGSRVHAIIPPLAVGGPYVTIRKFRRRLLSPDDLVAAGTCTAEMMRFLGMAVQAGCNLVVSGGTGSGKTTTLNALSTFIPRNERIITIEDAAELMLRQEHVLSLEARPANIEGKGAVGIRTLLRNALRMRPDRIIIGEVRGAEAFDLLQALNTGHSGSMTTVHANGPRDAIHRIASMVLTAAEELPLAAVLSQIGSCIHLIAQQARLRDGSRRITSIAAVEEGRHGPRIRELYRFEPEGVSPSGQVLGSFRHTGAPVTRRIAAKFQAAGLPLPEAAEPSPRRAPRRLRHLGLAGQRGEVKTPCRS